MSSDDLRFGVALESLSEHCCFEATVIDTVTGDSACKCFSAEDAQIIANALNKVDIYERPTRH